MMLRWRSAASHLSSLGLQRESGASTALRFRNYSKVAAAAGPATPPTPPPSRFQDKPEVRLNAMFWAKPCSLALPPNSSLRIEEPQYEGIRRIMLKLLLFYSKQSKSLRGANTVYRRIISQVDKPAIYDGVFIQLLELCWIKLNLFLLVSYIIILTGATVAYLWNHIVFHLEKTFKTTFSLLVLHMWLFLRRLKEEGKEGGEFGQYLYEIYNHDLELRVSKAGVNLLLTKWMKDLEKIFYGNIVAYDAAMSPEAKHNVLANVIWRNVFSDDGSELNDATAATAVQAMARYTRRESTCLSLTEKEAIFSGNFVFTSLEIQMPKPEKSTKQS